jgi:Domain of unknown function (DUF5979)
MDASIARRRRMTTFRKAGWLAVAAMVATAIFVTPGVALGQSASGACAQVNVDFTGVPAGTTADVYVHGTTTNPIAHFTESGFVPATPGTYDVVWSNDVPVQIVIVPACGELQITKRISGASADFAGGQFGFMADCEPGDRTYTNSITFGAGDSTGSVNFSVPAGLTCVVTETGTPDAGAGFTWLTPIIDPPVTIVSDQTVTVTVTDPRNPPASPSPSPSPSSSASPSPSPSPSPSASPSPSPSPSPSASPSPTPIPTPTSSVEAATSTPTGAVGGATGKPHVTPPPTATLGGSTGQPAGDTWRIALLGLAALLASLLVFSPSQTSSVRRRR